MVIVAFHIIDIIPVAEKGSNGLYILQIAPALCEDLIGARAGCKKKELLDVLRRRGDGICEKREMAAPESRSTCGGRGCERVSERVAVCGRKLGMASIARQIDGSLAGLLYEEARAACDWQPPGRNSEAACRYAGARSSNFGQMNKAVY